MIFKKQKGLPAQAGVSLIITFFVMIIILSVVLSISALLYSEVKVLRNIGNSVASFYVADSGIEKVLYYDRQVLPNNGSICSSDQDCVSSPYVLCSNGICTIPSSRGICTIFNTCISDQTPDAQGDRSIYCEPIIGKDCNGETVINPTGGCDPETCENCSVSFNAVFNRNYDKRNYCVTARVYPNADRTFSIFEINSRGAFSGTKRQIQAITATKSQ